MCCSGQVTSYLLHPDLEQRTKTTDRVGARSERLSSQTQLKSRTLLENVTESKSNRSLHKVLHFAKFIPLTVVVPLPPPSGAVEPTDPGQTQTITATFKLTDSCVTCRKKGLLTAFQLIGGEREKQPGR